MEKSRYAPLVKLKKKSLDEAERFLIAANNEVAGASDGLSNAYITLSKLSLPRSGSVRELSQANLILQAQHLMIEQCQIAFAAANQKKEIARNQFNQAMIEFEKFKYLEVQEVNAQIKKMKISDAKMLDEIGTMTYKREPL